MTRKAGRSSTAFTKAESRHIPTGRGTTADMAHPTRTGDLVALRTRRTSSTPRRPGELVAPSHFSGSTATCPTCGTSGPRSTCARRSSREVPSPGRVTARSIDLTLHAGVSVADPRATAQPGQGAAGVVKRARAYTPVPLVGLNDFHGQLDPTTLAYDNGLNVRVGGGSFLARMFDEELAALPGRGLLLSGGDNVGVPAQLGAAQDMPAIDVENAWGRTPRPAATTSSTTGSIGCSPTRSGRTSRSLRPTSSGRARAGRRPG